MFKATASTDLRMTKQGKQIALENITRIKAQWAVKTADKKTVTRPERRPILKGAA
jgi:hypothetical protein